MVERTDGGEVKRERIEMSRRLNARVFRFVLVLSLVANGYTNKEIANELSISVKTVETHKTNSMQKLDLKSRAEVVDYVETYVFNSAKCFAVFPPAGKAASSNAAAE